MSNYPFIFGARGGGGGTPSIPFSINGTEEETLTEAFNLVATLDGVPGGTYNAATDTLAFTSNSGWIRPSDWPALPTITAANERFAGVVAVFENGYNLLAIEITAGAANINWGDGTSVVSNGATQTKVYTYSTIAATVYQWPDGRNVKYVLVDITRVGGALARVVFWVTTTINAKGGNNYVDILCSFPNASTFVLSHDPTAGQKSMDICQRVRVLSLSAGAGNYFQNGLKGMRSLRVLEWPYSTLGQHNELMRASGQVDDLGVVNWGTNTSMTFAFAQSNVKKHGNLTANSATTLLNGYAFDCPRLEEFGSITATSATTLASFFSSSIGCPVLTKVGTITAPACTSIASMFFLCQSFQGASFASCANIVTTTSAFNGCSNMYWCEMTGLTRGISFANTAMGNYGMNLFANSIGTASGAQTITITGTPFGALVTAADATAVAIALVMTTKGYTIAN